MASPILYVEMLTVGRRRRYFLLRVAYALLLLIAAWICYESTFHRYGSSPLKDQAEFAYAYFIAFTWIQLLAVVMMTPAMLAGTIASEHERRTIDYLLTTPLNDWEIALGKFTARFGAVAYQLAVGWPILAIFMTLGGVGPDQLAMSFGTALLTLMSTASMSLAISARAKKARESITRTYLVLIALLLIPPMAAGVCAGFRRASSYPLLSTIAELLFEPMQWLSAFNPFVFLFDVLLEGRMNLPIGFAGFATGHLAATAFLLYSSVVGTRRFYLRSASAAVKSDGGAPARTAPVRSPAAAKPVAPVAAASVAPREELLEPIEADPAPTAAARVTIAEVPRSGYAGRWLRTLENSPMLWKELVSERTALKLGIVGKIAAVLIYGKAVLWIIAAFWFSIDREYFYDQRPMNSPMQIFAMTGVPMMAFLALLLVTSRAAGSLTAEKEQDTWLTLLSTPLEGREIVRAKILGALSSVRYWYYLVGVTWLLCVILYPPFIVAVPFLCALHLLAALFCACVGVRASLTASTSLKAMGGALAAVFFGAAVGPLIAAGVLQTVYATPFSLPTLICYGHAFFTAILTEWHSSSDYSVTSESEFVGMTAMGVIAVLGYAVLTWFAYQGTVNRFDEYSGRIRPRPGGPPVNRSTKPPATLQPSDVV
ncbi:MAG: hypothetical protein C0483_01955 [Pirellula sp.]|nr:hypothetical protein [Pirellula sp.]